MGHKLKAKTMTVQCKIEIVIGAATNEGVGEPGECVATDAFRCRRLDTIKTRSVELATQHPGSVAFVRYQTSMGSFEIAYRNGKWSNRNARRPHTQAQLDSLLASFGEFHARLTQA